MRYKENRTIPEPGDRNIHVGPAPRTIEKLARADKMRASAGPAASRSGVDHMQKTDLEPLPSHWLGKPTTSQRIRVLCAAERIFARDGFNSAEQIDIASLARVGKSTLYKVADGKQALFLLVVSENLAYMQSLVFARLISPLPPLQRIHLAVQDILTQIQNNRGLLRVIVQEVGVFGGEIQRRYLSTIDTSMPMVEALFNLIREQTKISDVPVRDILNMIVNMLIGTAYSWAVTGEGDIVEEGMRYLNILEKALLSGEQ